MIISPFNPLFFLGQYRSYGEGSPFTQVFSPQDHILIQVIRTIHETPFSCSVHNAESGTLQHTVYCRSHQINSTDIVDCYTLPSLANGIYLLTLDENISEPFMITDESRILEKTVLIKYSPANNSLRRDVVAFIGEERVFFSFRIPGGFKDNGWSFSVENDQFTTDMADIIELYGMESTQKTLTIGLSYGVPIWYGQLLNRILVCKYVFIDGIRFTRYQSSVPEKQQTMDGVNSFVFTQKLQEIRYLRS